ncbi:MAG: hypothetical protein AB7I19_18730 [Planctomycetota bacterium]
MTSRPLVLGLASIACVMAGFYTGTCAWQSPDVLPRHEEGAVPRNTSAAPMLAAPVATSLSPAVLTPDAPASRASQHRASPTVPPIAKHAAASLPALPASVVARRIGLLSDDPRAAIVAEWVSTKLGEDHRAMDSLDSAADRDKRARMSEFNAATEARRIQLIDALGADLAARVVEEYCLYRFDLEAGSWFRIDVHGNRLPFEHDDDDIWQNGERSVRHFHNHARN